MVSPFLFFADERLSLAELSAACLDGLLVPLGEGFMPADAAETAWMRARSLSPLLGERWAAIRRSAAWIHGVIAEEPSPHHLQRVRSARVRALSDARTVFHDVRLDPSDVCTIAGVHLTSPARTLVDLARSDDEADLRVARGWTSVDAPVRQLAESWLERHPRFPRARHAATLLSDAGGGCRDTASADSAATVVPGEVRRT